MLEGIGSSAPFPRGLHVWIGMGDDDVELSLDPHTAARNIRISHINM